MASYHFSAKIIQRSAGRSVTAAAAYRAREAITDARTGTTHDYSRMQNAALFTGLFVPADAPAWARERASLWNAVEAYEKRKDAQLARDFVLALPHEMDDQQRQRLVIDFAREQFLRRGYAADVAIHRPEASGDQRNHHVHILVAMRTLDAKGFARTKDRRLNDPAYLHGLRERWAHLTNRHLERYGIAARVDHRRLQEQGIDREPGLHLGKQATAAARKGRRTERGDRADAIAARNAARGRIGAALRTVEQAQQRLERPFQATQAQIFDARFAADTGRAFVAALAAQDLRLAQVAAEEREAVTPDRPPVATGAFVAVDRRGQAHPLTVRNTGLTPTDCAAWLKDVDGHLPSVTATRAHLAAEREDARAVRAAQATAGRAVRRAGQVLGTAVERVAMPLLASLADMVTGSAPEPSSPAAPPPRPTRAPEPSPVQRMQAQARTLSPETPTLDPQTAALRQLMPQALTPEKMAHIQRLEKAQAASRRRDNARDEDGRDR